MKAPTDCDGTFSLGEIAPIVGIPEGTLYRLRWQGFLLTANDYLIDPDMAFRIATADNMNAELRGPMPLARFNFEDIVRLRIVGFLGDLGWDRPKLLAALARPYALPEETSGDGHTASSPMPEGLVLWAKDATTLDRKAFDTLAEAHAEACSHLAMAVVINLDSFRHAVRQELAQVDLAREAKQARKSTRVSEMVRA